MEDQMMKIFNNLRTLADYHSTLHLLSYSHIKLLNRLLITLQLGNQIITSIIGVLNLTENEYKKEVFILTVITTAIDVLVHKVELPKSISEHYSFYNNYRIFINRLNTTTILETHNKEQCLKELNDEINKLFVDAPEHPYYVLWRHGIQKQDVKTLPIKTHEEVKIENPFRENYNKEQKLEKILDIDDTKINNFDEFINKHKRTKLDI